MPEVVIDPAAEDAVRGAIARVTVLTTRDLASLVRQRAADARRARARRRILDAGLGAVLLVTASICTTIYVPAVRRAITGNTPSTAPVLSTPQATGNVPVATTAAPAIRTITPPAYPPTATVYPPRAPASRGQRATNAEVTGLVPGCEARLKPTWQGSSQQRSATGEDAHLTPVVLTWSSAALKCAARWDGVAQRTVTA
jgi:hypothetical protein